MPYYISLKYDLAIAQIPRAGSRTFKGWLGKPLTIVGKDDPQLLTLTRRVAFFREPLERLKSAFSLMYWLKEYDSEHHSKPDVTDWPHFVDHILNPSIKDDPHWMPQVDMCGDIPNIYHKFENLADHWERYRPGMLPHHHRTSRRPTTVYRQDELADKYSRDYIIWEVAD